MSDAAFTAAANFIWAPSNDGSRNDSAPGETFNTVLGITQMTWDGAVSRGIVTGALEDATREQCLAIYRAEYWNALSCDSLPGGVAIVLFNDSVLTGSGHVARLLQRVVGTPQDGVIGPATLTAATATWHKDALIDALIKADETYLAALRNAPQFINGWDRREEACRALAHSFTV